MPVQAGNLDNLVVTTAFLIEASLDPERDDQKINNTGGYVQTVKAGNHEKGRTELSRTHWIGPWPYAFIHDEFGLLKHLHADEHRAEYRRGKHEPKGLFQSLR